MKRWMTLMMAVCFALIYLFTPYQSIKSNGYELEDKKEKEAIKNKILSFDVVDGKVNLLNGKYAIEEDRLEGKIGSYSWIAYEGVDNYIYVNGQIEHIDGKWEQDQFWIPVEDFKEKFDLLGTDEGFEVVQEDLSQNVCSTNLSAMEVIKLLENPNIPIQNATITEVPSQLPGAPRNYRNGFHEGFDWYSGATGTEVTKDTQIYPLYEGKIVRIDHDYVEMTPEYREEILNEAQELSKTSQETLDKVRGRQVWIESENGILVRYAHLDSVNPDLSVGSQIDLETWLGTAGNSGTSNGTLQNDEDVHLHTDILVCGKNFWEYGDKDMMVNNLIDIFKSYYQ